MLIDINRSRMQQLELLMGDYTCNNYTTSPSNRILLISILCNINFNIMPIRK